MQPAARERSRKLRHRTVGTREGLPNCDDVRRDNRQTTSTLAKLDLEKDAFAYTREDGASIAKTFSIEPAGDGRYSVLIEGRSYQVVLAGRGEIVVNGRTLRVERRRSAKAARARFGRKRRRPANDRRADARPRDSRAGGGRPRSGGRPGADCGGGDEDAE